MELRDKLNTSEGYLELINKFVMYLQEDKDDIEEYDEKLDEEKIKSTYWSLYKYSFKIITAQYSLGYDIEEIHKMIPDCIFYLEKSWEAESGYIQMINILSICIMLDIEDKKFEKLIALIERDKVQDYLIDYLIKYRKKDWQITEKFLWDKPYKSIAEIVELSEINKKKSADRLKKYLTNQWYKSWNAKDAHKSKWNIHTGYWSFESGAIAKILDLDDTDLKEQQYYPYDLVHFKNDK